MKQNNDIEKFIRENASLIILAVGAILTIFLLFMLVFGFSITVLLSMAYMPLMIFALPLNALLLSSSKSQIATSALITNSLAPLEAAMKAFAVNVELLIALMIGLMILSVITKMLPATSRESKEDLKQPKKKEAVFENVASPQKALSPYFNHVQKNAVTQKFEKEKSSSANPPVNISLRN